MERRGEQCSPGEFGGYCKIPRADIESAPTLMGWFMAALHSVSVGEHSICSRAVWYWGTA